ncbi:MAG: hypothetical protein ACLFQX_12390 [Candidatus Kapaibacterium sp.]
MSNELKWTRGLFGNEYTLIRNNKGIGGMKSGAFSFSARAEIDGRRYDFIHRGSFRRKTIIYDRTADQPIGEIVFHPWLSRAFIRFSSGKMYKFRFTNLWETEWAIQGGDGGMAIYSGNSRRGEIYEGNADEASILAGLYIANNFWEISMIVIIMALISSSIAVGIVFN